MFDKKSFIVLTVAAASAAANDQCSWSPPQPSTGGGSIDTGGSNNNSSGQPTVIESITDSLCRRPSVRTEDDWWQIQSQIDNLQNQIQTANDNKKSAQRKCDQALTVWKQQYSFQCPATQPSSQDYKSFLPAFGVESLNVSADGKRRQADSLRSEAQQIEDRINALNGDLSTWQGKISEAQAKINKLDTFKNYWNSKGGTYAAVDTSFTAEIEALTKAQTEAVQKYNDEFAKFSTESAKIATLLLDQSNAANALTQAVATYLLTFQNAVTTAESAALQAANQAKSLYDSELSNVQIAYNTAKQAYDSAIAALNIAGLEIEFNTAYAAATQAAQSAFDAQQAEINRLDGLLKAAQLDLQNVQQASAQIPALTTCVSTAEKLWKDALAADATDVTIYEPAYQRAKNLLDTTTSLSTQAQIEAKQLAVKTAQEALDAARLLLPPLQTALTEANTARDAVGSAASLAKIAWQDAQAKVNSDENIKKLNADMQTALTALNSPAAGSQLQILKAAWDKAVQDQTSGAEITKAKQALQVAQNSVATEIANYATLQDTLNKANAALSTQQNVVNGLDASVKTLENAQNLAIANLGKYDQSYFNSILAIQKSYEEAVKKYPEDITLALRQIQQQWTKPNIGSVDTIIQSLQTWLANVAAAFPQKSVDASGKEITIASTLTQDQKNALFAGQELALESALVVFSPELIAQTFAYIENLVSIAAKYKGATYTTGEIVDGIQTWEVTYASGVKATIFDATKTEQEEAVAAGSQLEAWSQIKPVVIDMLQRKIIKKAQAAADLEQKNAQTAIDNAYNLAITTAQNGIKLITDQLNGTPQQGVDPAAPEDLSAWIPDLVCSGGKPYTCDGATDFTVISTCTTEATNAKAAAPATTTSTATSTIQFVAATLGKTKELANKLKELNDAKALQADYADFIAFRTKKTNELTIKQKGYKALVDQLKTYWLTIEAPADPATAIFNEDLCTPCDPCAENTADTSTVKLAKTNMTRTQLQAVKEKQEIDAMQLLISNLSDEAWATNQKTTNDSDVLRLQGEYDSLVVAVAELEQSEARAKQGLEALRSATALEAERNKWKTKFNVQITQAEALCNAADAEMKKLEGQYGEMKKQISDLDSEISKIQSKKTELENAGCEASVFLTERINEYKAAIEDKKFQKQLIKLQSRITFSKDDFDFDQGWNDYFKIFKDAKDIACKAESDLRNELSKYIDTTLVYLPKAVAPRACNEWCQISSWAAYKPDLSKYGACIQTYEDLDKEIAKVIANPTSAAVRQKFLDCVNVFPLNFSLAFPNYGIQWDNDYGSFNSELDNANCKLKRYQDEYNYYVGKNFASLRAQADQLDKNADAEVERYNREWANNAQAKLAVDIRDCQKNNPISNFDSQIRQWNDNIATLLIKQSGQYESYWRELTKKKQDEIRDLQAKLDTANADLNPGNDKIFKTVVPTISTPVARRMLRRELAAVTRTDLSMIKSLAIQDKPSKIKICSGQLTLGTDAIVGFQMYYGSGSIEVAGPAHGDVSQGCTDYRFNGNTATDVNFYTDTTGVLQGIEIKFGDPTVTFIQPIQGGKVAVSGQLVYETAYASTDDFQFFGFDSNFEDTTLQFQLPGIATYNPKEYASVKTTILETPALITQAQDEEQASLIAVVEWEQVKIYQDIIEADVQTGLEKVKPGNTYILRKSEAEQIQKDIDAQIEAIKKEQAAYNKAWKEAIDEGLGGDDPAVLKHSDDGEPQNAGAIVAVIIGCLMLIAAIALLVYRKRMATKYSEMRKAGGRPGVKTATLVNQSSFRSDNARPDDI